MALTSHSDTPLHIACQNDQLETIIILMKYRATIKTLPNKADIEACDIEQSTPLHVACFERKLNIVKFLVQAFKANVDAQANEKFTPLHIACQNGDKETVEFLLKNKASVEALTSNGLTPLHVACHSGHVEIVELLMKFNGKMHALTKFGSTMLHLACFEGHLEVIKLLIQLDPSCINAVQENGATALHIAVQQGHVPVIEYLLASGASTEIEDIRGITALNIAFYQQNIQIMLLLAKHGMEITDEEATKKQHVFFEQVNEEESEESYSSMSISLNTSTTSASSTPEVSLGDNNASSSEATEQQQSPENVGAQEEQYANVYSTGTLLHSGSEVYLEPSRREGQATSTTSTTTTTSTIPIVEISTIRINSFPTTQKQPKKQQAINNQFKQKNQIKPSKQECSSASTNNLYVVWMHENFKWPKSLNKKQQGNVLDHVRQLRKWPNTIGLDIKELKAKNQKDLFRMRVGGHRVIFSVDTKNRQILIHEIGLKKQNFYKNIM